MSQKLIIKKSISISAPIEKVWDALTNPALTPKYMYGCAIESGWKVGDEVLWKIDGKVIVKGYVVQMDPGKHLEYTTFDPNMGLKDIPANNINVTYTLTSQEGSTLLEVTQGDFAKADNGKKRYEDSVGGWDQVLQALKELAES